MKDIETRMHKIENLMNAKATVLNIDVITNDLSYFELFLTANNFRVKYLKIFINLIFKGIFGLSHMLKYSTMFNKNVVQ